DDADDLAGRHVDDDIEPGEPAHPSVAHAADVAATAVPDAPAALLIGAEVARRTDRAMQERRIVIAAALDRGDEVRVLEHVVEGLPVFARCEVRLNADELLVRLEPPLREVDDGLERVLAVAHD